MARAISETTRRRADTAVAPARPMVRDFSSGARAQEVTFDARPAYDFLISAEIGKGEESDLLPEDRDWLRHSREALGDELCLNLDACFGEEQKGIFHGLATMLAEAREVRVAADVIRMVDAAGSRGVASIVIQEEANHAVPSALIQQVLDGDAGAIRDVEAQLDDWAKGDLAKFLGSVARQFASMRAALIAWLPYFQQIEERIAHFQDRDVASRRSHAKTLNAVDLIEQATGGLRWTPESQTRRVILAPSYFSRPFNYVYRGSDWRLFAYPISDAVIESADLNMPPASVVRLYRTLGDPTRLRTLKLLSERDWYLTELATQLELSKPTMKHHLAQMRAAGLVTVTEEGSLTYYSLRRERIAQAGPELSRFLS